MIIALDTLYNLKLTIYEIFHLRCLAAYMESIELLSPSSEGYWNPGVLLENCTWTIAHNFRRGEFHVNLCYIHNWMFWEYFIKQKYHQSSS